MEWEKTAHRKLMHCTDEELRIVYDELTSSLKHDVQSISVKYERRMSEFFEENKGIMMCELSTMYSWQRFFWGIYNIYILGECMALLASGSDPTA